MEFCIAANPIYFFATTNFTNENIRLLEITINILFKKIKELQITISYKKNFLKQVSIFFNSY